MHNSMYVFHTHLEEAIGTSAMHNFYHKALYTEWSHVVIEAHCYRADKGSD